MNIPAHSVTHLILKIEGGSDLEKQTDKPAKNVFIETGDYEEFLSDNYFDLLPGWEKTVNINTNISEDKPKEILSIRTLFGAF